MFCVLKFKIDTDPPTIRCCGSRTKRTFIIYIDRILTITVSKHGMIKSRDSIDDINFLAYFVPVAFDQNSVVQNVKEKRILKMLNGLDISWE